MSDLVEKLRAHMGNAEIADVLQDCREAAHVIEVLRGELLERCKANSALHKQLVNAKTALESAHTLILSACIASCTCLTKTPDAAFHTPDCRYAKLQSGLECVETALRTLTDEVGKP